MAFLFGVTVFVAAALLFSVQPMIGKMVLPVLGGAPSVWITCLLFFQTALLVGYAYAHLVTARLATRWQLLLHLALLTAAFALMPLGAVAGDGGPASEAPVGWLLARLLLTVGLPAVVLAATGPLLQRWYAGMYAAAPRNPYVLYSASNAGSLLALLGYALVVEPSTGLAQQSTAWSFAFDALCALSLACALVVALAVRARHASADSAAPAEPAAPSPPVAWRRRLRWGILAFAPASLMLGVTQHITSDIAPVPLLWIIPLALYLLSFVLVFAKSRAASSPWPGRALLFLALVALATLLLEATRPPWLLLPLHLTLGFLGAWVCHRELYADRPPADRLTDFYLTLAIGGALGGVFNAVVAPTIFSRLEEYPLVLVLCCALVPRELRRRAGQRASVELPPPDDRPIGLAAWSRAAWQGLVDELRRPSLTSPLVVGLLTLALILVVHLARLEVHPVSAVLVFVAPLVLAYASARRPARYGLSLLAILLASHAYARGGGRVLLETRSFFGVSRVAEDPSGSYRLLVHGSTIHGLQSLDPARSQEAHAYYHPDGPVGDVFRAYRARPDGGPMAVLGLGAGVLAAYKQPGDDLTFYELDPTVVAIAQDPRYFTFLRDAPEPPAKIVLGDARRRLAEAPERHYGLIFVDAFSSDAMPAHLLTREALALYRSRLRPDGMLVLNLSTRYLDLRPIVTALAADAGLVCRVRDDREVVEGQAFDRGASRWAVIAAPEAVTEEVDEGNGWVTPAIDPNAELWTDDHLDLLTALRFTEG